MSNGHTVLPDPTADLHWSDYRGAIHDLFTANALRHPNRLCVVETESSITPRREFDYGQINRASNLLAHHFIRHGIQCGDVVMVYAHRGVDLVVAVMGILKAGATFSVIDPAYPPDRQVIYLDVAKPRGLVVIQKASQEAGELTEHVRSYISKNLDLRIEVPALLLQDDGKLIGGSVTGNGEDVLQEQLALAEKAPEVVVGPDSTPTLSFTSGSEGRPKGVRGRHFSLAYYFPWMSKAFNLTEDDKFTMLSGIAHDPIQRDIFTPLFLGAQLLVPAREDIQHELLAEWMNREKATITHLTPAMGQILVGGASAVFPSLHHAFFVGDILIKRDCKRLQELAPNVNIVNMYGTTETQRAVSYFEIPSRNQEPTYLDKIGDIIPAGRGMYDVQLLVVDRDDRSRLCGVGEVGEIYVRAGGLAEGYLGQDLEDLTRSKFVENWFVDTQKWIDEDQKTVAAQEHRQPWREFYKGPRDRLYRSGDLGRYMPTGDVQCTGRIDSQIKIRGFRVELGEIDTLLSQHFLVRENCTLLRRDKDEEPTLVSYVVPEMQNWYQWLEQQRLKETSTDDSMVGMLRRFKALVEEARTYLRTKLPAYAIPTVFVPLRRMPLNPNGKIDKPALPFPDAAELHAASLRRSSSSTSHVTRSETESLVAKIWANLIPHTIAKTIRPEDSFFDIGGHSILAQRVIMDVKQEWKGTDISMVTIIRHSTLRAFSSEIDRALDPIGLRLDENQPDSGADQSDSYSADALKLEQRLLKHYPIAQLKRSKPKTVLLTGATGFLGAYILRDLLNYREPPNKVIVHVRSSNSLDVMHRIQRNCQAYGIWSDSWKSRIKCVTGDLQKPKLGLSSKDWDEVAVEADVIVHNGAQVHWVLPYEQLKASNVISTLDAMELCASAKSKAFTFVSSTSVLDTDYYVKMSEGGTPIPEEDSLEGSRKELGTGYGQSKWVSEYLVREAGRRGLRGTIVRPGYVTGDSTTGGKKSDNWPLILRSMVHHGPVPSLFRRMLICTIVTNTDDFLVRMLKGCIQLQSAPTITNTINMVPVDHVARVVVSCAFNPPVKPLGVAQVTGHPRMTFIEFGGSLAHYGYQVPGVDYESWRRSLEIYVKNQSKEGSTAEEHALMPLYHFVTGDLPAGTKAPELSDINTATALRADAVRTGEDRSDGAGVTLNLMGLYIAYLVATGFLPPPSSVGRSLPAIRLSDLQRESLGQIGGRGVGRADPKAI
ncbi:large subunit of alpha-aminoadipate reductase [Xylographa soralifera]|nr:large subunit of alpha-aminoadipate reductase [Xylographa soralifera]